MRRTFHPRGKFSPKALTKSLTKPFTKPCTKPFTKPCTVLLLAFSLAVALTLVNACTKRVGSDDGKNKYSRETCPNIFVAELFSTKDILDELRDTTHKLTFTKVTALCKVDKRGVRLLNLSFNFLLEPRLSKQASRRKLLLPLFAIASRDEKTVFSRTDKILSMRFTASGRAETRWSLVLESDSSTLPRQADSKDFSLYLGFDGADRPIALRDLLE